ncbi:MAG: hypothetical protein WAT39_12045 [Planctomycetota bacterium]
MAGPLAAPGRRRRRHPALLLSALLLGLFAAALLVEAGFRLLWTLPPYFAEFAQAGMYVQGPAGGVALVPGYRGTLRIGDAATTAVNVNAAGLRGAELPPAIAGQRRVLVLGDSVVFGYGVEDGEALPARIEQALRTASVPAVVGNAGISGTGVNHAVERLAELDASLHADAFVLCAFLGNDAIDLARPLRTVYAGLLLQAPVARLVHTSWRTRLALRSRAWLWFEAWILTNSPANSPLASVPVDPAEAERAAGLPSDAQLHAGLFLDAIDETTAFVPGQPPLLPRLSGWLRESLVAAKTTAGRRPLLFVVLPTLWQVDDAKRVQHLRELGFDPGKFDRGRAQQRWLAVARDLGVTALDATPILAAEPDPAGLFLADGGHLSVRGSEVVGTWLAGELAPLLR